MQIIQEVKEYDIQFQLGCMGENKEVVVLSFSGSFDVLSAEAIFVQHRALLKEWLGKREETKKVIFDFYSLVQINSFAIGHITSFLLILYKRKISVTVAVNLSSMVYQTLNDCGFYELHGLDIQESPLIDIDIDQ